MSGGQDVGTYRTISTCLVDQPGFQKRSVFAQAMYFTLRLTLGPAGIGIVAGGSASFIDRIGRLNPSDDEAQHLARIRGAQRELEAAGMLEVEGSVWWLRDALADEVTLKPSTPNHVKFIRRIVASLPHSSLVDRWRAHYHEWSGSPPESDAASPPVSDAVSPSVSDAVSPPDRVEEVSRAQSFPAMGQKHSGSDDDAETVPGVGDGGADPDWDGEQLTAEARVHLLSFSRVQGHAVASRASAYRAMVRALGPGGKRQAASSWEVLSSALVSFAGSELEGVPGEPMLRRFIAAAERGPAVPGEGEFDRLIREEKARIAKGKGGPAAAFELRVAETAGRFAARGDA